MQNKDQKYYLNALGLPPDFLQLCEALGRAFVSAYNERNKNEVIDIECEVIETKQLTQTNKQNGTN